MQDAVEIYSLLEDTAAVPSYEKLEKAQNSYDEAVAVVKLSEMRLKHLRENPQTVVLSLEGQVTSEWKRGSGGYGVGIYNRQMPRNSEEESKSGSIDLVDLGSFSHDGFCISKAEFQEVARNFAKTHLASDPILFEDPAVQNSIEMAFPLSAIKSSSIWANQMKPSALELAERHLDQDRQSLAAAAKRLSDVKKERRLADSYTLLISAKTEKSCVSTDKYDYTRFPVTMTLSVPKDSTISKTTASVVLPCYTGAPGKFSADDLQNFGDRLTDRDFFLAHEDDFEQLMSPYSVFALLHLLTDDERKKIVVQLNDEGYFQLQNFSSLYLTTPDPSISGFFTSVQKLIASSTEENQKVYKLLMNTPLCKKISELPIDCRVSAIRNSEQIKSITETDPSFLSNVTRELFQKLFPEGKSKSSSLRL